MPLYELGVIIDPEIPPEEETSTLERLEGIITEAEARSRRSEITREADFYGAMDGASKYVRGDAIAGILITLINIESA